MNEPKGMILEAVPQWVHECLSTPSIGVHSFLEELRSISGARYAHIRILSRSQRYYVMVDSIGPYKTIGWRRRFRLLDNHDGVELAYQFIHYRQSRDCKLLQAKYANSPKIQEYLESLDCGLWIPLHLRGIHFGYITLSWTDCEPDEEISDHIMQYVEYMSPFIPVLYSAARSVIANEYLADLWTATGTILSAPKEAHFYERLAEACCKIWGADCTAYVGKPDPTYATIEVIAVAGRREHEAESNSGRNIMQRGEGLFGYALKTATPVLSTSLRTEDRFQYHSMLATQDPPGSALAMSLHSPQDPSPLAVFSVEHEMEGYFDEDDFRYLTGLARIGYEALAAHKNSGERIAREIDTLFTTVAHDIHEPIQALVADADILRYQAGNIPTRDDAMLLAKHLDDIAQRASNILETSLELNGRVRNHLEIGVDGASTRVIEGRVHLYRLLNSLVENWEERAATQGVDVVPLFDSLRDIEVQCDEAELKSALSHLLGNAIKYWYSGRRLQQGPESKFARYVNVVGRVTLGKAVVEFQNFGVGILKTEFGAVKEKYYRGVLALGGGRAGTGRGLWSANTFFTGVGGYIEINSEYKGADPTTSEGPYFTTVKAYMPYLS